MVVIRSYGRVWWPTHASVHYPLGEGVNNPSLTVFDLAPIAGLVRFKEALNGAQKHAGGRTPAAAKPAPRTTPPLRRTRARQTPLRDLATCPHHDVSPSGMCLRHGD